MRITQVLPRVFTKRFDRPLRNPRSTWNEKNTFLVFVIADSGITGVGEAWCEALSPKVLASFVREELSPMLVGLDVEDVARVWQAGFDRTRVSAKPGLALSVLGAAETAIWDILAKLHGRPLHRLL